MMVYNTAKHVLQNDDLLRQCLDPATLEAVLLEGARVYPPVAGFTYFRAAEDKTWTLSDGRVHTEHKGDVGFMVSNAANHDPSVFGGAKKDFEYAKKFIPGRENADRLLTWGAELRDLRSCPTAAGCKAAPRPCPGAHLSFILARDVLKFFCEGASKERKQE